MSALARGRRAAVSRMTSAATVWREDPANPTTVNGLETSAWAALYTALPGRLTGPSGGAAQSRRVTVGLTEVQVAVREWHCPTSTTGLRDGDVIAVTAGEHTGIFLRVVEASGQDQATARRLPVVEIQKPGGIA